PFVHDHILDPASGMGLPRTMQIARAEHLVRDAVAKAYQRRGFDPAQRPARRVLATHARQRGPVRLRRRDDQPRAVHSPDALLDPGPALPRPGPVQAVQRTYGLVLTGDTSRRTPAAGHQPVDKPARAEKTTNGHQGCRATASWCPWHEGLRFRSSSADRPRSATR